MGKLTIFVAMASIAILNCQRVTDFTINYRDLPEDVIQRLGLKCQFVFFLLRYYVLLRSCECTQLPVVAQLFFALRNVPGAAISGDLVQSAELGSRA